MRTPRLLPLAAVAIGGVLAAKALGAVDALPAFLASATAYAAVPAPNAKPAAPAAPPLKPGATPIATKPPQSTGVCGPTAAELAKEAGLSPAELQMLQSLGTRRGQLDAREQALDAQIQLLAAAEVKVDAKIKALNAAKAQVEALVGQADTKTQAEVDRLVVVYEKMKPRDAGAIFATLDDKVRVPVAAKIAAEKPAILGAILAQMGTLEAKKLTESLAHRFDAARAAAEAVQNPANKAGGKVADAAGAAPTDAKPVQVASADGAPTSGADTDKAPGKAPTKPRPVKVARDKTPAKPVKVQPDAKAAPDTAKDKPAAAAAAVPKPAVPAAATKSPDAVPASPAKAG